MSPRSSFQDQFSERPFTVGSVYAYREFNHSSKTGKLHGMWAGHWTDGENVAKCVPRMGAHGACDGSDLSTCSCGYYAYWSSRAILNRWQEHWACNGYRGVFETSMLAVTEHYGETLMGTLGVRSRKAKIVAIGLMLDTVVATHSSSYSTSGGTITWSDMYDDIVTRDVQLSQLLQEHYPSAELYVGAGRLAEMHAKYGVYDPEEGDYSKTGATMMTRTGFDEYRTDRVPSPAEQLGFAWGDFARDVEGGRWVGPTNYVDLSGVPRFNGAMQYLGGAAQQSSMYVSQLHRQYLGTWPTKPAPKPAVDKSEKEKREAYLAALEAKKKRNPYPDAPKGVDWRTG